MTAVQETTNVELLLAASLMARPEYVNAVFPPVIPGQKQPDMGLAALTNEVARAAIITLSTQGPAFATPSAMLAVLRDSDEVFAEKDVVSLVRLIPEPNEVTLEQVLALKSKVVQQATERTFARRLRRSLDTLGERPGEEVSEEIERALADYRRGTIGRDSTATGIAARLKAGQMTTRWRCGCSYLDAQAPGIRPDGTFDPEAGMLGQGEIVLLSAMYGVGKTRVAYNWIAALLDQGASVSLLVTEDNEASYSIKLMAARFGIEKHLLEAWLANELTVFTPDLKEKLARVAEAWEWYQALGDRLRIYDGSAKANIFNFSAAKALLEEDAKLYGATHTVCDYIQAWAGDEETLSRNAQALREYAGRNNVGLVLLSQIANETMKFGAVPGQVPAKGSGAWGAIAHWGFYLTQDVMVGQKELCLTQAKGRDAGRTMVYAEVEVRSGKILSYYGTPKYGELPQIELPAAKGRPKKKSA